jgi:hypothetical protein
MPPSARSICIGNRRDDDLPILPEDLEAFMDQIFESMKDRFEEIARELLARINDRRGPYELRHSIDDLMKPAELDRS